MNFDLVRIGWPNTMAIAALAILPLVALAAAPHRTVGTPSGIDAAAICPAPLDGPAEFVTLLPTAV